METHILEGHPVEGSRIVWDSNHLNEYIANLAQDPESLLPPDQYPNRLQLDVQWHDILNRMRSETEKDGKERWAPIGLQEGHRVFFPPAWLAIGSEHAVLPQTMDEEIKRYQMIDLFGMRRMRLPPLRAIGDIHSHPTHEYSKKVIGSL